VLDANFKLMEGNGPGVAEGVNIPDEYGYETALQYLDRHGKHIQGNYGFWVGRRTYDRFGNYDATWFENPAGELAVNERLGYALANYTWDRSGRFLQSIAFFDTDRKPVLRKGGYHRMNRSYNDEGLLSKITFVDADGKMVNRTDNGAAVYDYVYDERNQLVKVHRFSKEEVED
jgi:YD repeat-containing protein